MNDEEFLKKYPFKVGDEVVCIAYEIEHTAGEVVKVGGGVIYPIKVDFGDSFLTFTSDGRFYVSHRVRLLYHAWENPEIITKPVYPTDSIAVDTLVRVRDSMHDVWTPRYATGEFDADGCIRAWLNGATSKTAYSEDDFSAWRYYEVVE